MRVHWEIALAISEGVKAGVFRRAARLNCHGREIWEELADRHSQHAAGLLGRVVAHNAGRIARRRAPR